LGTVPFYTKNVMKFATKLLLVLSGAVLVSASAMIIIVGSRTTRLLEAQLVARLEDNAQRRLENLARYFYGRSLDIRRLVAHPGFLAAIASPEQTTRHLEEFLRWHHEYLSASFSTMERVVVADTAGPGVGEREDQEGCWADIASGKDIAVCTQRFSPGDSPTIGLALVVRDGRVARGVVVLRLPLQVLEEQLRDVPGLPGSTENLHVDLLDRNGVILYSNHEPEMVLRETSPDWDFMKDKIDAGWLSGSLKYTNPAKKIGEEILIYVHDHGFKDYPGSGWTLNLFVPTQAVFTPIHALRLKIATAALVTGSFLLVILFLLVRAFTRPITELDRAAREIGKGNLGARVPAGLRDELGLFAETFNQMAADLQVSQRQLAAFSSEMEGLVRERTAELLRMRLGADIGEALTLDQDLETALQLCAGFIARDLDAVLVRVWTLGGEAGVLELRASAGLYTRIDGRHSRKIVGQLKIGIIAQEQRPMLTNVVIDDAGITDQEWVRREGIASFAGYPLIVDRKTVGVLALFARRPLEQHVLSSLAIAAEKVALYLGRKTVEGALRESEKRYRDLFEFSIDGVYEVNAAGVFTSMNPAGALIFGHASPDEIMGRSVLDYWRDFRDREVFLRELKDKKTLSAYPVKARKKNGELLELEASTRIVENADGDFLGVQGVLRDVTQRVKTEMERGLLLAQLQEAAKNIRNLSGLLPICAGCKKIRDDKGSWNQIETYISRHSAAEFSHGLCPECLKVYFPGLPGKS